MLCAIWLVWLGLGTPFITVGGDLGILFRQAVWLEPLARTWLEPWLEPQDLTGLDWNPT